MNEARGRVVAEAMTWLRTPYHHYAAVKGVGADCAMFPLAVYQACGVLPAVTIEPYQADWHLHRSEERYLAVVQGLAREIDRADLKPADFVVWRFGRCFSHGGIVIEAPSIIHAFAEAGCVTLDDFSIHEELRTREMRCFSLWSD